MASFVLELWELIFTPGTNGALLVATHALFVLLLTLLAALTWYLGLIHFLNLLVIASVLYGLVIWFIGELRQAKLKTNEELKRESDATADDKLKPVETKTASGVTTSTTPTPVTATKRKV
ncbi:hypothetical protein JNB11_00525 [Kocuria palustris]|nr:hypothetical protein [Kocuria palustris]